MDFSLTPDQLAIRDGIAKLCEQFDAQYWLERDRNGGFPEDFHRAVADAGWLGIAMPSEFGGAGLGITEAALMMQTISESGAGFSGASAVHMNIFGLNPVVVFGTAEQKRRWLPPLIRGGEKACFAVTEPNAGLNTAKIATAARREGDRYVLRGQKIWISTAQVATKMLILARTAPATEDDKPTAGLSLFYTDLDRRYVEVREIEKMGRKAVDSNLLFIEELPVPAADRIGEDGKGFDYILHGLNPERILIAAEAIGLGTSGIAARSSLCKGTRRLRSSHRTEPGDSASAREMLDGARGCELDGVQGGGSVRQGRTLRRGGECREVSSRRSLLPRLRAGHAHARWHGLREGVSHRALSARSDDPAPRASEPATHLVFHRREGTGIAEIVLATLDDAPIPSRSSDYQYSQRWLQQSGR